VFGTRTIYFNLVGEKSRHAGGVFSLGDHCPWLRSDSVIVNAGRTHLVWPMTQKHRARFSVRKFVAPVCVLAAALLSLTANAQVEPHGAREFAGPGIWTVPSGVTRITIELWGAGGGGAGGASGPISSGPGGGGGGGGSGAYVRTSVGVKQGEQYTIRIGGGGQGGRGQSNDVAMSGDDGEDTVVLQGSQVVVTARGGGGGKAPKPGSFSGGASGQGGRADPSETLIARPGNSGQPGDVGGSSELNSASGGSGGVAVFGSLKPLGSFGGDGGAGRPFGSAEDGKSGGSGSAVITW
jgi:hypothetical protein